VRNTILRDTLLGLFVFSAFAVNSQNVGINLLGLTPTASAILDLKTGDANLGFLAPQASLVSNVDVATIAAPATGLIVYNTNAGMTNGNGVGYYYYTGAKWVVMSGPVGNWLLTGNTGTSPATNWIGTDDANAFQFKVNGVNSGWIDYSATAANTFWGYQSGLGIATGSANAAIGYQAFRANTSGTDNAAIGFGAMLGNTVGANNIAIGYQSLYANTTGGNNTAIGYTALVTNTTGINNTAIGLEAAQLNSSSNGITALGAYTLINTTGGFNTAIGLQSGQANAAGQYNSFLGMQADANGGGYTNSSAIGSNAYIGASNVMILGSINGLHGGLADVNVGIGTNTPTQKLHINNGNILISNGAIGADAATVGQIQFQDASGAAGYSTFQAGAQGAINYNYILPTSAPTVGSLLGVSTYTSPNAQLGYVGQPSGILIGVIVVTATDAATAFAAGTTFIVYKIIGGGGAGGGCKFTTVGGCITSTASVADMAGTGGGAGGYSEGEVTGIQGAASTYQVNIGAGGVGQAACGQPAAGNGGNTVLTLTNPATVLTAPGGSCGLSLEKLQSVGAFNTLTGGAGGVPTNAGALNVTGGTGGWGNITQNGTDACESGTGASSIFGGGGSGFEERDIQASTGNPASAYGSGGSGGTYPGVTAVNSTCTGGNGSSGIVIIYEYK
jgi:trimeric autotransporter adhesin